MLNINDVVTYKNEGVCIIKEVIQRESDKQGVFYYILKPVYNETSTIYIPTNNEELVSKMKKVLSKEQIEDLIKLVPAMNEKWVQSDNHRKDKYKDVLKNGDRTELISMIKDLYVHSLDLKEKGKKFHVVDDRMMKEAQKMLYEEFAYVLDIHMDEVEDYISKIIEEELIKK